MARKSGEHFLILLARGALWDAEVRTKAAMLPPAAAAIRGWGAGPIFRFTSTGDYETRTTLQMTGAQRDITG